MKINEEWDEAYEEYYRIQKVVVEFNNIGGVKVEIITASN